MTNQAYQLCKFMKEGFLISFIFLLMILWLSSCSDLQKESSNSACNAALDNQDFDTAISVCTSSKGKGDAYMGKGGFTVTNLLNKEGIFNVTNIQNTRGHNQIDYISCNR